MSEPGTELFVPTTGEIVDLRTAPTEELAAVDAGLQDTQVQIGEAKGAISDELVARLDRSAAWTLLVGDPTGDRQFEIKAPSPAAGADVYAPDLLREALNELVDADTISEEAAAKALQRRLVLELSVPWDADLSALAETVKDAVGIQIAGVEVDVVHSASAARVVAAGVKALQKIPGMSGVLSRARVDQPPAARRATVKVKVRG
jgi:hypothetical protein